MISFRKTVLAALTLVGAGLLLPGIAQAQSNNGYTTGTVNMRAAPRVVNYPSNVIVSVPAGAPVFIYGCLSGYSWCDTQWQGYRGWISGRYLDFYYQGNRYGITYGGQYGLPFVTFNWGAYNPPAYNPPAYRPPTYTPPAYTPPYVPPAPTYNAPRYAPPRY